MSRGETSISTGPPPLGNYLGRMCAHNHDEALHVVGARMLHKEYLLVALPPIKSDVASLCLSSGCGTKTNPHEVHK